MQSFDETVGTRDGYLLRAKVAGAGSDCCVLIHGFGEGAYIWDAFADALAPFYRVVAIDLRGHGQSDWDRAGRYPVEEHVLDVIEFLGKLNFGRAVVIGHSLGGEIAIRLAASRPRLARAIVSVDHSPEIELDAVEHLLEGFRAEHRTYGSTKQYAALLEAGRPLADPKLLRAVAAGALRRLSTGGFALRRDPALANTENVSIEPDPAFWSALASLSCPMLLIRGAGSAILRAPIARRIVATALSCTAVTIPFAGHSVMLDNPSEFHRIAVDFISRSFAR